MSLEEVETLQRDYKADPKNKGKSVPDRVYREARTRPLLLLHVLRATNPQRTLKFACCNG